jgi:hypothetical protein
MGDRSGLASICSVFDPRKNSAMVLAKDWLTFGLLFH